MRRVIIHFVIVSSGVMALAGCGLSDIRAPVPEFMRSKTPEPAAPEPLPDIKRIVRDNLESMFTTAARPIRVRVSTPRREPVGAGWTACVRAEVSSVTGAPLNQTYRVIIAGDLISERRRVEDDDNCATETYEPI